LSHGGSRSSSEAVTSTWVSPKLHHAGTLGVFDATPRSKETGRSLVGRSSAWPHAIIAPEIPGNLDLGCF
jgi:hypothetical protein